MKLHVVTPLCCALSASAAGAFHTLLLKTSIACNVISMFFDLDINLCFSKRPWFSFLCLKAVSEFGLRVSITLHGSVAKPQTQEINKCM